MPEDSILLSLLWKPQNQHITKLLAFDYNKLSNHAHSICIFILNASNYENGIITHKSMEIMNNLMWIMGYSSWSTKENQTVNINKL
jgi:hypothetical protein